MNTNATQLLRILGSGVRPINAAAQRAGSASGIGSAAFSDLLKQAQDGGVVSKVPVTIAGDANLTLSDTQLGRLSLAADKLEAAGVKTALVTIDGQKLVMDVHSREIKGVAGAGDQNGIITGIDGVMDCGDERGPETGAGLFGRAANALAAAQGSAAAGSISAGTAPLGVPSGSPAGSESLMRLLAELQAS